MFLPIYFQLRRTVDIAVRAENYAAAKMLLDARGGPVSTQYIQFYTSSVQLHIVIMQDFRKKTSTCVHPVDTYMC